MSSIIEVRNWCSTNSFSVSPRCLVSRESQRAVRLTSNAETWPILVPGTASVHPPLRVEREADVRLLERPLPARATSRKSLRPGWMSSRSSAWLRRAASMYRRTASRSMSWL